MKWNNKGKQYKEYEKIFGGKSILIYGAGKRGIKLFEMLKPFNCVEAFIDQSKSIKHVFLPVMNYAQLQNKKIDHYIIVIAAQSNNEVLFAKQLMSMGLREGKDYFFSDSFVGNYLDIYLFYSKKMVYAKFISMQVSTICNLKCEGCVAFTPYNEHPRNYDLKEIYANVDNIFNNIDYIEVLDVGGGEPFLMFEFGEILSYIAQRYRNRINILRTVTNGTIVPKNDLCEILKESNTTVILDDYRSSVKRCAETFEMVKEKLDNEGVSFKIRKSDYWIDLGVMKSRKDIKRNTEVEMINHFNECGNDIRSVHHGRLYICDYADFARESEMCDERENDYIELSKKNEPEIVLEFLRGYTDMGYCSMCARCNGCVKINRCYIGVAKQIQ